MARLNPELNMLLQFLRRQSPWKYGFNASTLVFDVLQNPNGYDITCLKSDDKNRRGKYFVIVHDDRGYGALMSESDWKCWDPNPERLLAELIVHLQSGSRVVGWTNRLIQGFVNSKLR